MPSLLGDCVSIKRLGGEAVGFIFSFLAFLESGLTFFG
jgi:hypothetical protein